MLFRIFLTGFLYSGFISLIAQGNIYVVSNTLDDGEGSFRQAAIDASGPGDDTIVFDIPLTDPGFDPHAGVWTIVSHTTILIPDNTVVDGGLSAGDNTIPRPGIMLNGSDSAMILGYTGLRILSHSTLRNLGVNNFQYGIWVQADSIIIENCFVGTDPEGTLAVPNGLDGILVANGAVDVRIQNNLLSGNSGGGIRLFGLETRDNIIRGNRIGTDLSGTAALPNKGTGLVLHAGAHNNLVEANLISGNNMMGISLRDSATNANILQENLIGTDITGELAIPNASFGCAFFNGPSNNTFGPGNRVAFNGDDGVLVDGANLSATTGNRVTMNSITNNSGMAIDNLRGGNTELPPPVIDSLISDMVYGTAAPGQIIELFFDTGDEGCCFFGVGIAESNGVFKVVLPEIPPDPLLLTANAADSLGNTSEFSEPFCPRTLHDFITGPTTFCPGTSIHLNAGAFDQYRWSNGATTEVITIQVPGTYYVTVTDSVGCSGSDSITIIEYPAPVLKIDSQENDCAMTRLDAGEFDSYLWTNGENSQIIEVISPGFYSVVVTDSNGCSASDSVMVESDPLQLPWVRQLTNNPFNPYCDECLTLSLAKWMDDPVFVYKWEAASCNFTDLGFTTIYTCTGDTLQYCYNSIAGVHCDPDSLIKMEDLEEVRQIWQCTDYRLPDCPDDTLEILALPWIIDTLNHYQNLCDLACAGGNAGNFLYQHLIDTSSILELRTTCSDAIRRFYDCQGNLIYTCTSFSEAGDSDCDLPYLPSLDAGNLIWECSATTASRTHSPDNSVKLFPTLFSNQLFVEVKKVVPKEIIFYDSFGQVIKRVDTFSNNTISTQDWPCGVIYSRILFEEGSIAIRLLKFE